MAEVVDGEDRISELPIHIMHDILRRIRQKRLSEEAQTCVLSKTWNSIWRTRPHLIIRQPTDRSFYQKIEKNWEDFVKYVDDFLRLYVEQNLRIETLRLTYLHPPELASHIDRWIKLAMICNVKFLSIDTSWFGSKYSIPDSIYASNKTTLSVLHLEGCNFEIDNSTINKLQGLISTNPLIRDLRLIDCVGFPHFDVSGLVNLEKLMLSSCRGLVKVEIWAPNLREFIFVGVPLEECPKTREPEPQPCTIDILDGCNTLEYLSLEDTTMTDQQLEYQLFKFPALEVLSLNGCYAMKNIKIISEKLKRFSLHWGNLEQVNILAPNLMAFDFDGYKLDGYKKYNYFKGLILAIHCKKDNSILIYENPRKILIPPTQDLDLHIENPATHLESFVNSQITWSPKIISIVSCTDSKLLQVFHETAAYTEKQKRGLKEVTIHKGAAEIENGGVLYTWLKSKPLIERSTTFNFEWKE